MVLGESGVIGRPGSIRMGTLAAPWTHFIIAVVHSSCSLGHVAIVLRYSTNEYKEVIMVGRPFIQIHITVIHSGHAVSRHVCVWLAGWFLNMDRRLLL